jgi:hypothetical protein
MKDWRKDPAAHDEWERRNRQLIIVPAAEVDTELDHGKYEPAIWNINPDNTKPERDWGSN